MAAFLRRHRLVLLLSGLVAAAVALAFGGVVRCDFLRDWDDNLIYANPHLASLSWANIRWAFADLTAHPRHVYMPLSWVWWMLVNATLGLSSSVYHGINLAVHAANSVLVFLLVRRILRRLRVESAGVPAAVPEAGSFLAEAAPAAAALFWALNPLRVEPVAWAITQKFLLATLLALLSLAFQLRWIESTRGPWRAGVWYGLSLASFGASLLFYPVALAWPAVFAIVCWAWPQQPAPASKRLLGVLAAAAPFALASAAAAGVPLLAAPPAPSAGVAILGSTASPWAVRPMEAAYVWMYFAWKPLVPTGLCPIYTTLLKIDPWTLPFIASLAGLAASAALLFAGRRRWPWAAALGLCHLALLLPVLGVGLSTEHYPNDRYAYLPGIAGTIALGIILASLASVPSRLLRMAWLVPAAALLAALAFASARQTEIWRDVGTFYRAMFREPHVDEFRYDLRWRLAQYHIDRGEFSEAREVLAKALKAGPDSEVPLYLMAVALGEQGNLEEAEQYARRAVAIRPRPDSLRLLAQICLKARKPAAAADALRQVVAADPDDGEARYLLAAVQAGRGSTREALAELDDLLKREPANADARALRGRILLQVGAAGAPDPGR